MMLHSNERKSQKLPSKFEIKLNECQDFVIRLSQRNNYSLSQISTADKTDFFLLAS
jgi:hypothetical protein